MTDETSRPIVAIPTHDAVLREPCTFHRQYEIGGLVAARREFERGCIEACLERTGGNITQAAQWLGIERSNLHKKIQALGLDAKPRNSGRKHHEDGES